MNVSQFIQDRTTKELLELEALLGRIAPGDAWAIRYQRKVAAELRKRALRETGRLMRLDGLLLEGNKPRYLEGREEIA